MHPHAENPLVLHVRVMSGNGGGPEKTILNSPKYLAEFGYRSTLAYMADAKSAGVQKLQHRADDAGAELVIFDDRGPWDWKVIANLVRYCRRNRVSIWHGHDYKSNALGLLVCRFWPMKLVTTLHGWVDRQPRARFYEAIDRRCIPWYHSVICVSDDLFTEALCCGVKESNGHLIHNAIEEDVFRRTLPRNQALSQTSNHRSSNRAVQLGAAGRLSPEKGFDVLIDAVSQLVQEGVPVHLKIAGDGHARASLESQIAACKCASNVSLLGHVCDTRAFYEDLDVFVLSSRREGLPNVVLEAMSMEVPVLATRVAGIPKLIEHQRNGLLIDPEDVQQMKAGIRWLVDDPIHRNELSKAARQTIENRFGFRDRMRRVVAIYDELLGVNRLSSTSPASVDAAKNRDAEVDLSSVSLQCFA